MSAVAIALVAAGAVLIVLAVWRARPIWARAQDLDRLAENARRYESWRGGRKTAAGEGESGADVMREMLGRQLRLWIALGGLGAIMLVGGLLVR